MESKDIPKVKRGWRLREDLDKILTLDDKANGRSPAWHVEMALLKHLKELGLITQSYIYDGRLDNVSLGGQLSIEDIKS